VGANFRRSQYLPVTLPMRHRFLLNERQFKNIYSNMASNSKFITIDGTHALASVSAVVSSIVVGVVALCIMLQHDVLAVAFFPAPMPEKSSGLFRSLEADLLHSQMPEKVSGPWNATFYIPPCQKILVPGARPGLPPGDRILWQGGM
jgi:hypothetical protein